MINLKSYVQIVRQLADFATFNCLVKDESQLFELATIVVDKCKHLGRACGSTYTFELTGVDQLKSVHILTLLELNRVN